MSREEPKKKERQKRQRILCVLVHVGRKLRVRLDVDIGGLGIELGSIPNSPMVLKWAAIQILMFGWLLHSVLEFAHLSSLSRPQLCSAMELLHSRSSSCTHG